MNRPLQFRDLVEDLIKDLTEEQKQAYCILYTGQMFRYRPSYIIFHNC